MGVARAGGGGKGGGIGASSDLGDGEGGKGGGIGVSLDLGEGEGGEGGGIGASSGGGVGFGFGFGSGLRWYCGAARQPKVPELSPHTTHPRARTTDYTRSSVFVTIKRLAPVSYSTTVRSRPT